MTYYLGVNGRDQFGYDGMLYVNSQVRDADVPDGPGNTIMVGERPPAYGGYAGWWFAGVGLYPWFGAADVVLGSKERIALNPYFGSRPDGEQAIPYQRGRLGKPTDNYDPHAWHFGSFHPGGSNFLFADGSVRFIKYSISQNVLPALATRDGGEVVSHDEY